MADRQLVTDDEPGWLVVRNEEGRYSVWIEEQAVPSGWDRIGPTGSKSACLAWIKDHWIDPRPAGVAGEEH